ncbi:MASE1 domain-containing protein [Streptomyces mangrovisoli]|uniref:MASE1 domain-containing protein n=1 Tax=Streptomyces mangrovisoli TaxID=1428628 RepID=UPI0009A0E73F|nr:MASE1 domain-containing protein [Streptomyces mangrovisoli]
MVGIQDLRRPAGFALLTVVVAACYFGAGRLGLLRRLVVDHAVVTPIWPPTGVALACLLFFGLRAWLGIALGSLLVVVSISAPHPAVMGILAGNTVAPVCAYLLLRRVGFRNDLSRFRDGLALVFLAALAAMLISSTVGVWLLVLTGKLPGDRFWTVWPAWWVGDAMGVLIVTPLLLAARGARWPPPLTRWKEVAAFALGICALVPLATLSPVSLLFLVYPLLICAALRFQLAGSMVCALLISVMATVSATRHIGPFEGLSPVAVMMKLQAFNGAMALTALLLSAVITEQRNTRRSVELACQELVEVLEHLTAGEPPPRDPDHGAPRGTDEELLGFEDRPHAGERARGTGGSTPPADGDRERRPGPPRPG